MAMKLWPSKPPKRTCPDRKSTRLNSSHANISYAVFCLKKKSRHRRYRADDVGRLQALACLRARGGGQEAAGEQRDRLWRHAWRVEAQIAIFFFNLDGLRENPPFSPARPPCD